MVVEWLILILIKSEGVELGFIGFLGFLGFLKS